MTVTECVGKIYRTSGLIGFYKGITASYFGISETVIHFVIYEAIKSKIVSSNSVSEFESLASLTRPIIFEYPNLLFLTIKG